MDRIDQLRWQLRRLRLGSLFLLLLLLILPGANRPAEAAVSIGSYLNADGTLNLPAGRPISSLSTAGYRLVTGAAETPRFTPEYAPDFVQDDANWDPRFAQPNLNNTVNALAWDGDSLYAGGNFTAAGLCTGCNRVARWDGRRWQPLAFGLDGTVNALAWGGSSLYASGLFTTRCEDAACSTTTAGYNRIAHWDGTAWNSISNGLNSSVNALAWDGSSLYAGGFFNGLCANAACSSSTFGYNRIARWDGSTWNTVSNGLNGTISALIWNGGNLYAGGLFTRRCEDAGCSTTTTGYNRIARWDGAAWNTVGFGLGPPGVSVSALAWDGSSLYAGGGFTAVCNDAACSTSTSGYNRIARWDGSAWNTVGFGLNNTVNALAWQGSSLYAGGSFTALCNDAACSATTTGYNRIARWDGSAWNTVGFGLNSNVNALAWNGSLYAGGGFALRCDDAACTANTPSYNRIARWDDSTWQPLERLPGLNNIVSVLAWDGSNLYAGGSFTAAGLCAGCNRVARWDGRRWQPLAFGLNSGVLALVWGGSSLYASGNFSTRCDDAACSATTPGYNRIARWDGTTWNTVGLGLSSPVRALAWDGSSLYAGGDFTAICANATCSGLTTGGFNRIARWDGTAWNAVSLGLNNNVSALAWDGNNLYAGGSFSASCTNSPCTTTSPGYNRIARWDGSAWNTVSFGLNGQVFALVWAGSNLYAGGGFAALCNDATCSTTTSGYNRIARWDGSSWNTFGFGLGSSNVRALAWDGSNLYAGGDFTTICNDAACSTTTTGYNRIARWDGSAWNSLGSSGLNNTSNALAWAGGGLYDSLYAGGDFTTAGSKLSFNFGRWRFAAIWDGGGADNNGSTAGNWNGNSVPLATDVAIFDATSSKNATLDGSFPAGLRGLVLDEEYEGSVGQARSLAISQNLEVHGGGLIVADPGSLSLSVEGSVLHSGGSLTQTRPVNNASVVFLHIQNAAATVTKYRGVEIDSTAGAANLGNTTVAVQAIETADEEYCTGDGVASPAYALRCFTITPTSNGAARVRLYALTSQLNGITEADLAVYHHTGGEDWSELTNRATGSDGGSYRYSQGDTTGFSAFLLGQTGNAPTAITAGNVALAVPARGGLWAALLTGAAVVMACWRRRRRVSG